jgi:vacuole morphology and inheritance protein 14
VLLNGERIYQTFARLLLGHEDLDFISVMVQTLNLILLTSSELFEFRSLLKQSLLTDEGRERFISIYKAWCHNPVATFSLCLMAQCYELGSALVFHFANIEVTVPFMMQIDKLVQLIESPIFIHLRLQLLEPQRYPFLLKSLYGLMMLLPQSSAFSYLKTRLDAASAMGLLTCIPPSAFATSTSAAAVGAFGSVGADASAGKVVETQTLNFADLLGEFCATQQRHAALRKVVLKQSSLVGAQSAAAAADDDQKGQ